MTCTTLLIVVFGLPASGKSTLVRLVKKQLLDNSNQKEEEEAAEEAKNKLTINSVSLIELDDILLASSKRQQEEKEQERETKNSEFNMDAWFEAREQFQSRVAAAVSASVSKEERKNGIDIIFAVDNLPLKSMRWRLRSAALSSCSSMSNSSSFSFAFATLGLRSSLSVALERNKQRNSSVSASASSPLVPASVIELMNERIEFDACKNQSPSCHFVVENEKEERSSVVQHICEDILVKKILNEIASGKFPLVTPIRSQEQEGEEGTENLSEQKSSSSKTLSHRFDLVRRKCNGNFMLRLKASGVSVEVMKSASKTLDKKFGVDIDRKLMKEFVSTSSLSSSSSEDFDQEQAQQMLEMARDAYLAELISKK